METDHNPHTVDDLNLFALELPVTTWRVCPFRIIAKVMAFAAASMVVVDSSAAHAGCPEDQGCPNPTATPVEVRPASPELAAQPLSEAQTPADDPAATEQDAKRLFAEGRYVDSAEKFGKVYRWSNDPALLYNMAVCYRLMGDPGHALILYEHYLMRVPGSPYRVAAEEKISKLREELSKASTSGPAETEQSAKRLFESSRYAEAATEFERAYRTGNDPAFLYNMAICYRRLGDLAWALISYEHYLAKVPDSPNRTAVADRIRQLRTNATPWQAEPSPSIPAPRVEATRRPIQSGDADDPGSVTSALGTAIVYAGLAAAALGLGVTKSAASEATHNASKDASARYGLLLAAGGMAVCTGGFALRILGHGHRHQANVRAGFVPSRSMTGPWVWTAIGGAISLAGVAVAVTGVATKYGMLALGGGLLAGTGTWLTIIPGEMLAARITYVTPEEAAQSALTLRPWVSPIVFSTGPDQRTSTGLAAGFSGTF